MSAMLSLRSRQQHRRQHDSERRRMLCASFLEYVMLWLLLCCVHSNARSLSHAVCEHFVGLRVTHHNFSCPRSSSTSTTRRQNQNRPKESPFSTAKSNQRAMLCSIANVSVRVFCIRKQQHIVADKTSGEYGIACWDRVFFVWQKGAADAKDFYWYVFFVVVCFR